MIGHQEVPRLQSITQLMRWADQVVTALKVGAAVVDGGVTSFAQITVDQNDYSLPEGFLFRLASDAARTITGFTNGTSGRYAVIANVGAQNIIIANESASSAAANRVVTGTGASVTLTPGTVFTMIYDSISNRWRSTCCGGGGGGGGTVTSVAGGVGITNTPEPIVGAGTVDLDINSLTTETALASGDLFAFVDVSVGVTPSSQRKVTAGNIATFVGTALAGTFQPLDADLTAIAALAGTGIAVRTTANTWALRNLVAPAAGFSITNADGVGGNPTFVLANDLGALEGLAGTGIAVRSAADTWVQRTIVSSDSGIVVTNGDGVSGNPSLALADAGTLLGYTKLAGRAGTGNDTTLSTSADGTLLGSTAADKNLILNASSDAAKGSVLLQNNFANLTGVGDQAILRFAPNTTISNNGNTHFVVFESAGALVHTGTAGALGISIFGANSTDHWRVGGLALWTLFGGSPQHLVDDTAGIFPGVLLAFDGIVQSATVDMTGNLGYASEAGGLKFTRQIVASAVGATNGITEMYAVKSNPVVQAVTGTADVTTLRDIWIAGASLSGGGATIATHIGVDIASSMGGTTIRSIRSLGASNPMIHNGSISVGAGNAVAATNTKLDVNGGFATRKADTTVTSGTINDLTLGNRTFLRITSSTGAFTITSVTGGEDGKLLILYNQSANAMTVAHEAGTGTAANRFHMPDGSSPVTTAEGIMFFVYDSGQSRWIYMGSIL